MNRAVQTWRPRRGRAYDAIAWLLIVAGCGDGRPARVPVSGRVLIDGKPLSAGNIRVYPAANRAATAKIEPDGRFTLSTYEFGDGCVIGVHPVSVMGSTLLNARTMRWFAPKKYASAQTSGLVLDVKDPTDSAQIQLNWDGGKQFDEVIVGGGE